MNHVLTIGDALCVVGLIMGTLLGCFGALELSALSDAPVSGNGGCVVAVAGFVIALVSLLGMVL